MPLTGKIPFKLRRALQLIGAYRAATLSAGETLDTDACQFQVLNPNGSNRTIVLPVTSTSDGWWVAFKNSGTSGNLIINDAAAAPVATVTPGQWAIIMGNAGTGWAVPISSAEPGSLDLNGAELILDADADTSITADTDDQIDFRLSGADDFRMIANYLLVLSGSAVHLADSAPVEFGNTQGAADISVTWDATKLAVTQGTANSAIHLGVSGAGIDLNLFGDTATYDCTWDQSRDTLAFADNARLGFGSGAGAAYDIEVTWNGTKLLVSQLTANSAIDLGVDGAGIDLVLYGDTASAALTWDQSADALVLSGVTSIRGIRTSSATAGAITGATVLTLADSGGVFSVSQAAAYDIDLPSPTTGAGCRYTFYLTGAAANNVTITVNGGAATFVGTIVNDVTSVIPATGSTLTFASGVAALGDNIEITSISTGLYLVRAVTSANGGITIA